MKRINSILATCFIIFVAPHAKATVTYEIIDLQELYAPYSDRRPGWAFDINDNGVIVGEWFTGRAMYIDPELGHIDIDLGSENYGYESINGINNNNDVVAWNGVAVIDSERFYNSLITRDGDDGSLTIVATDLTGGGYYHGPIDIDDNGNIIERVYTGPTDLLSLIGPNSGWNRLWGMSMNIHGQIVGYGTRTDYWNNDQFAFLMNPIGYSVPAPASIGLLGLGLVGLGFSRRKNV